MGNDLHGLSAHVGWLRPKCVLGNDFHSNGDCGTQQREALGKGNVNRIHAHFQQIVVVARHGALEVIIDLALIDPGIAHCRRDAAHNRETVSILADTPCMTDKAPKKRPTDANQLGKLIVDISVGEVEDHKAATAKQAKDPAVVSLGRRGGLKGGNAEQKLSAPANAEK